MYHRERRKMYWHFTFITILIIDFLHSVGAKSVHPDVLLKNDNDGFDNTIIDFDSAYDNKYNKKHGMTPWNSADYSKDSHRYTVVIDNFNVSRNQSHSNFTKSNDIKDVKSNVEDSNSKNTKSITTESSFLPAELVSTTENALFSLLDSTAEPDLTVIPLSTTENIKHNIKIESVTLPPSTQSSDISTTEEIVPETTEKYDYRFRTEIIESTEHSTTSNSESKNITSTNTKFKNTQLITELIGDTEQKPENVTSRAISQDFKTNLTQQNETINHSDDESGEIEVPIFTELDVEDADVPEDYYDSKDVLPTKPPSADALSLIFGLAGSVVESMAERVVPKSIFDLFKRMQRQSEALEAEKLRSREENGGIGQFGRGLLKSISTGLSKPFNELMSGARDKSSLDKGSLDSDRGFVGSISSGVTSVATVASSVVDAFKNRVQAIYPGTVWCGDGHSAQARSSDLGLFFFTDTCCRQHDACKIYIRAGDTKYGLTNTGLFTRSHCSCDAKFRECLQKTNSLVSTQIGLTYFNVLGPQCFRKAHPIIRCIRKTRITGQKCEEYELDYTKPKMWQWFDNETY